MSDALNAQRLASSRQTVFDQVVPPMPRLQPLPPEVSVRWPRMAEWLETVQQQLDDWRNELQNRLGSSQIL